MAKEGMASTSGSDIRASLIAEIGFMRFEAIGHFISDGDFKANNESEYAGAFADYMEAWSLLATVTARSLAGPSILEGLSEIAANSGDPALQEEAAALVASHREEMPKGTQKSDGETR